MADAAARETLRLMLERARRDLLAAFDAKRDADRRYLGAFAAYEAAADAYRRAIGVPDRQIRRSRL